MPSPVTAKPELDHIAVGVIRQDDRQELEEATVAKRGFTGMQRHADGTGSDINHPSKRKRSLF
jgi:hypothetical protein